MQLLPDALFPSIYMISTQTAQLIPTCADVHAHKLPFNAILSYFLFIIVICLVAFITIFVAIVTCVVFERNVVLVITHN